MMMKPMDRELGNSEIRRQAVARGDDWVFRRFGERVERRGVSRALRAGLHPALWWGAYIFLGFALLFWLDSRLVARGTVQSEEFLAVSIPLTTAEILALVVMMLLSSLGIPVVARSLAALLSGTDALVSIGETLVLLGQKGDKILKQVARGTNRFDEFRIRWAYFLLLAFATPAVAFIFCVTVVGNSRAALFVDGVRVSTPLGVLEWSWSELESVSIDCPELPSYKLLFQDGRIVELIGPQYSRWETLTTIDKVMRHRGVERRVTASVDACAGMANVAVWQRIISGE